MTLHFYRVLLSKMQENKRDPPCPLVRDNYHPKDPRYNGGIPPLIHPDLLSSKSDQETIELPRKNKVVPLISSKSDSSFWSWFCCG